MFLNNSFGKTLDILHRSMDVSALRNNVIANNIANSDTPNFKRTVVNFETELRDALYSEGRRSSFQERLTHERHIPFRRPVDYRDVRPHRHLDYLSVSKNNGNNVDIEEESMNLLTNQMMYTMMTNSVRSEFARVNMVLRR